MAVDSASSQDSSLVMGLPAGCSLGTLAIYQTGEILRPRVLWLQGAVRTAPQPENHSAEHTYSCLIRNVDFNGEQKEEKKKKKKKKKKEKKKNCAVS